MAWTEYTNGLFSLSDFDSTQFGTDGDDELGFVESEQVLYIVHPTSFGGGESRYYEGNKGSDTIVGYASDDVIIGVDPDFYDAGAGEYDRLRGNGGYDTFVLGDAYEAYYQGNGYAIIEDFDQAYDFLAVHGSSSDYTFTNSSDVIGGSANDTVVKYQGDWVAVLEDTTVDLNTGDFNFL